MIQKQLQQDKIQLTAAGLSELKKELEQLTEARRPAAVDRLSNARSMGDLAENNDYQQAKEALEFLDGRISELEGVIKNAQVIRAKTGKKFEVALGTKVRVGADGQEHIFHIVGEWEADPKEKKISHESPLGQALMGKKVGEKVEVSAPAGKVIYTILGIE